ncbi:hypothetical protein A5692_06805 [Mycobacterium sp. E342]|uniref:DUF4229 domain-containing protein n=1 Tax=Mycobacterium sp. E342 TaxID=1834147 RepID=UPI0007FF1EEE|nr:DUF4229 domain-containing protein [Mycobacterium sp. E342]OBH22643.1 hypothetical protein A5692_06805 [Mycobacterium sp. E342]
MPEGASDNSTGDRADQGGAQGTRHRAVVDVSLYAAARLLLAVALAAAIYGAARLMGVREFPIAVAALFALIIAMPVGIWLFGPLRRRATASLAIAGDRRRREREQLRARLHGDVPPDEGSDDG